VRCQTLKVDLVSSVLDPQQLQLTDDAQQLCEEAERQLRDADPPL